MVGPKGEASHRGPPPKYATGASVSRGVPVYVPAVKLVPILFGDRSTCVNNLPKVVTRQCPGAESNLRLE